MTQKGRMHQILADFFDRYVIITKNKGSISKHFPISISPFIIEVFKKLHSHFTIPYFHYKNNKSNKIISELDFWRINADTKFIKNKNALYGIGAIHSKTLEYILST